MFILSRLKMIDVIIICAYFSLDVPITPEIYSVNSFFDSIIRSRTCRRGVGTRRLNFAAGGDFTLMFQEKTASFES